MKSSLVALAVLAVLVLFLPPVQASGMETTLSFLATYFFTNYGWLLNIAILLLFSAIISAQYLMTEGEA